MTRVRLVEHNDNKADRYNYKDISSDLLFEKFFETTDLNDTIGDDLS